MKVVLNSDLMIPDFPNNVRIRLAELKSFPEVFLTLQRLSNIRKQQKKFQFCQSYSYVIRKVLYNQI